MTDRTRHRPGESQCSKWDARLAQSPVRMIALGMLLMPLGGCLSPAVSAGRDADASVSMLRSEIRELTAAVAVVRTDMHAGRDVNENDKWTMRLLGLGVLMLGLTYPVGKIVWIASSAAARRAGFQAVPRVTTPGPDLDDFFPFRERLARRCDLMTRA